MGRPKKAVPTVEAPEAEQEKKETAGETEPTKPQIIEAPVEEAPAAPVVVASKGGFSVRLSGGSYALWEDLKARKVSPDFPEAREAMRLLDGFAR